VAHRCLRPHGCLVLPPPAGVDRETFPYGAKYFARGRRQIANGRCASPGIAIAFTNAHFLEATMSGTLAIHQLLRTSRTVVTYPSTRTPVRDRARAVVCVVDGTPVHALLPVSLVVNLERLLSLTGGGEIRLGREDE